MPTALCPCGQSFTPTGAPACCPRCATVFPAIVVTAVCRCTELLVAPVDWDGREVICVKCTRTVELARPVEGRVAPPLTRALPGSAASPLRWLFLLTLLPMLLLFRSTEDIKTRFERVLEQNPDARRAYEESGLIDDLFAHIPGEKLPGAFLPRSSNLPWILAVLSAAGFIAAFRFLVPRGRATWRQLAKVGVLTGTVGIFMLLSLQLAAFSGRGGPLGFLITLLYLGALHPDAGIVASLIAFTFGVGLLEELCKASPIVWQFNGPSGLDVRGAAAWGIASGVGFGISEAIHYSSETYNGLFGGDIYLVRFVSCVALHGVWAGTVAVLLWKRQADLADGEEWGPWFKAILASLAGPMFLHALYDTCAKAEQTFLALAVAALSFVWFLWLYGRADHIEAAT